MKIIKREKPYRKKGFPFGIFLLLFIIEALIALWANLLYFRQSAVDMIAEIEKYTKSYSVTLAEAFAEAAALSYPRKKYAGLKNLFQKKISENIIDEGFFILSDGKLIVHSNKEREKELDGNIANDEFSYNLDMVLRAANEKSDKVIFSEYNIIEKRPPFTREERKYVKEYIYDDINNVGWLVSRAVFSKGKPVGTVNFIIGRERIHKVIFSHIEEFKRWILISLAAAYGVSLIVSIIIFIRQRGIENRALGFSARYHADLPEIDLSEEHGESIALADGDADLIPLDGGSELPPIPEHHPAQQKDDVPGEPITIEILAEFKPDDRSFADTKLIPVTEKYSAGGNLPASGDKTISPSPIIRDAIPVTHGGARDAVN